MSIHKKKILRFLNKEILNRYIINDINKNYTDRKKINYIISGGNSLITLISKLDAINYEQNIILSDERIVIPQSDMSNMKMLKKNIPKYSSNNCKMKLISLPKNFTTLSKENLLIKMEEKIKRIKQIDFAILSIGLDGHFASIFSNKMNINNKNNFAIINRDEDDFSRITLNLNYFMKIKKIYFIINSRQKTRIYRKILNFKRMKDSTIPIINILNKRENHFDDKVLATKDLESK